MILLDVWQPHKAVFKEAENESSEMVAIRRHEYPAGYYDTSRTHYNFWFQPDQSGDEMDEDKDS